MVKITNEEDGSSDDSMPGLKSSSDSDDDEMPILVDDSDSDSSDGGIPSKNDSKGSKFDFRFPASSTKPTPPQKQAPKADSDSDVPPLVDDSSSGSDVPGLEDSDDSDEEQDTGFSEPGSKRYFQNTRTEDERRMHEAYLKQQREEQEKRRLQREEARRLKKLEREQNKKEQPQPEMAADIKPVVYQEFQNKPKAEVQQEAEQPKDRKCFLKGICLNRTIKYYEAMVLLKCNDAINKCRIYMHKSCWKDSKYNTRLQELRAKGKEGESVKLPCPTSECKGEITKIIVMMNKKKVETISLVSSGTAPPPEPTWKRKKERRKWRDEEETPPPPPVSAKKLPPEPPQAAPGAVLVVPYDPMEVPIPPHPTKHNKKKQATKQKEAQKEKQRVEQQSLERKMKNLELQEQAKSAPIPSLDQIPEGGEWKGPDLNNETLTTAEEHLRDLERIRLSKEKEEQKKKKKKKKEKQQPVKKLQELVNEAEKAWKAKQDATKKAAEEAAEQANAEEYQDIVDKLKNASPVPSDAAGPSGLQSVPAERPLSHASSEFVPSSPVAHISNLSAAAREFIPARANQPPSPIEKINGFAPTKSEQFSAIPCATAKPFAPANRPNQTTPPLTTTSTPSPLSPFMPISPATNGIQHSVSPVNSTSPVHPTATHPFSLNPGNPGMNVNPLMPNMPMMQPMTNEMGAMFMLQQQQLILQNEILKRQLQEYQNAAVSPILPATSPILPPSVASPVTLPPTIQPTSATHLQQQYEMIQQQLAQNALQQNTLQQQFNPQQNLYVPQMPLDPARMAIILQQQNLLQQAQLNIPRSN